MLYSDYPQDCRQIISQNSSIILGLGKEEDIERINSEFML